MYVGVFIVNIFVIMRYNYMLFKAYISCHLTFIYILIKKKNRETQNLYRKPNTTKLKMLQARFD
jgi:hypothetical protein